MSLDAWLELIAGLAIALAVGAAGWGLTGSASEDRNTERTLACMELAAAGLCVFCAAIAVFAFRHGRLPGGALFAMAAVVLGYIWYRIRKRRRKGKWSVLGALGYKSRAAKAKLLGRLRGLKPRRWIRQPLPGAT